MVYPSEALLGGKAKSEFIRQQFALDVSVYKPEQ